MINARCASSLLRRFKTARQGKAMSSNRAMSVPAATTQVSELAQRHIPDGVIDFAAGQPGPRLLPLQHIAAAAAHRLAGPDADPFILQYGPEQGYASFRGCLADFLTTETGHAVQPDELLITAGVSHGLDLACRHLASVGDEILVEQPTYFLAGSIIKQAGLKPVAVPTGPHGLDVEGLQQLLEKPGGPRPKLCYTIPVHNNPTGATIPIKDRMKLIQLAHQYDFVIVADEVYQLLSFPDSPAPPPPMRAVERSMLQPSPQSSAHNSSNSSNSSPRPARLGTKDCAATPASGSDVDGGGSIDPDSRVVSLGSFSKIMAPGLRLGWIDAAAPLLQKLRMDGVLGSGGSIAPLASGIAHSCLQLGLLQEHMHKTVRPSLQQGCVALCGMLQKELPAGCDFDQPEGGYFVWLQLPNEVCSQDLLSFAAERFKVKFTPGRVCDGQSHMLRLSFAFYSALELEQGARRLAAAIKSYMECRL